MDTKTVFVVMGAEIFHHGHLNIIKIARELGDVTVGLATDEFNASYKRVPLMSYEQRKSIIENIVGVKHVIPQDTFDMAPILREIKPDYFVHGDDWRTGPLRAVREQVIEVIKEWGGELVEPPYTEGVSSTKLNAAWRKIDKSLRTRNYRFRRMLESQPVIRILEVHNCLTGLIVEQTQIMVESRTKEFDGMWYSSLTDSLTRGRTSTRFVDFTSRINTIVDILDRTSKPLIVEIGMSDSEEQPGITVRTLERLGVSAIVIGSNTVWEETELLTERSREALADLSNFAKSIASFKRDQITEDFAIIPCIDPLRFPKHSKDGLNLVQAYIDAGADGLMIQSQSADPARLFEICHAVSTLGVQIPLLAAIPASSLIIEEQLLDAGVQVIIYPDQLLRAAYTSMVRIAKTLLQQSMPSVDDGLNAPISELSEFVSKIPI